MSREPKYKEQGSVLMLMPAAVLIVLLLGSIAVDFSIVFMAERELVSAAAAAANDAATAGVDQEVLRTTGNFVLDPAAVERVVGESLAARDSRLLDGADWDVAVVGNQVRVTVVSRAPYLFAKAIPGAADDAEVSATASADAAVR